MIAEWSCSFCPLQIRDSKPVYVSRDVLSGNLSEFVVDSSVADGFWHVLSLFSEGHNAVLLLDGKLALNITGGSIDVTPVNVEKIILGSAQTGDSKLDESGEIDPQFLLKVSRAKLEASSPKQVQMEPLLIGHFQTT